MAHRSYSLPRPSLLSTVCQLLDSASAYLNFADSNPEPDGYCSVGMSLHGSWGQSLAPMRREKMERPSWLLTFLWPQRTQPSSYLLPSFDSPTRTLACGIPTYTACPIPPPSRRLLKEGYPQPTSVPSVVLCPQPGELHVTHFLYSEKYSHPLNPQSQG